MRGIPMHLQEGGPEVTGLTCPECFGAIEVEIEQGHRYLLFRCRIGHTFTASELLRGKEGRAESLLWTTATAMQELIKLLEDLAARVDPIASHCAYERRIQVAKH